MPIQLPANGKTFINSAGDRSRYDYTDEYVIYTYEDIDGGEKFIRRIIQIGTFAILDGMWDLNSSSIEFEGRFEIVPNAKKTINNEYPAPPTILKKNNAEWGEYYRIAPEANRPILDESIYEHTKDLIFQYSDFGKFDGISFEEGVQPIADRSVITTNNLDKFIPMNWWQEPFSHSPKGETPSPTPNPTPSTTVLTRELAEQLIAEQGTDIVIPDIYTSIAHSAFRDNQITSVVIPDSVTLIEDAAFSNNQLTSVDIGDGVTSIGKYAFHENSLEFITISPDATFDLSVFPEGVEITRREQTPTPEPNPTEEDGVDEVASIDEITITAPSKFNKKSADKITNFNPSTDTLEIDTDSFGIDGSATFASGKNKKKVKKKLAKQDFDFLYDEKKGGLYFNENGADKGFGEGGIVAILKGAPDLTSDNLEFI